MILELSAKYEPIWLFIFLLLGLVIEFHSNYMLRKEFDYDEQKDLEKKQKRTRTTKKVTTQPGGGSITEESVETSEPIQEDKKHD